MHSAPTPEYLALTFNFLKFKNKKNHRKGGFSTSFVSKFVNLHITLTLLVAVWQQRSESNIQ
jgi:hypothetical protein